MAGREKIFGDAVPLREASDGSGLEGRDGGPRGPSRRASTDALSASTRKYPPPHTPISPSSLLSSPPFCATWRQHLSTLVLALTLQTKSGA